MILFWFTFSKPMQNFFAIFEKKVLYQIGPYINTFQTNIKNICLSVILEFCLSSIGVCVLAPAYTSLCREIFTKVKYIIVVDPLRDGFLIFEIFPKCMLKFSQNVCLINIYILIYRSARCDCKLWNALWFYYVFGYFTLFLL